MQIVSAPRTIQAGWSGREVAIALQMITGSGAMHQPIAIEIEVARRAIVGPPGQNTGRLF
jgi:hypothetical protein